MVSESCEGDGQHGCEAEGCVDGGLLEAADPEAAEHQPFLGSAEKPFHTHPPFEEFHQAACPAYDEVLPHSESSLEAGVPPDRDDGLCAVPSHLFPGLLLAVLGIGYHRLESEAQAVDPFEQRLEEALVVLVAGGDLEGEGEFRVGAAGCMHPVSEDEAPLAPAHPCVGVTPAGAVVPTPLAVGLDVSAVDCHDLALHCPGLEQPSEQMVE